MHKIFSKKIIIEFVAVLVIFSIAVYSYSCKGKDIPTKEAVTEEPIVTPTFTPTPTLTDIPTQELTSTPTPTLEPTPTDIPTLTPTAAVTLAPSKAPETYGYNPGKPGVYECEYNGKHVFKPYTDTKAYTAKASQQYKLQQICTTNAYGIRVVTDPYGVERMCVALGTAWAGGTPADIGRCVDIYMVNGQVLYCVLGDVKRVSDSFNCRYGRGNNDLIEFIVETSKLPEQARICGNCSHCGDDFVGEAMYMQVHDYFIEGFGK